MVIEIPKVFRLVTCGYLITVAATDDALDAKHMNVKPGGKQRIIRDTRKNGTILYTTGYSMGW